MSRRAFHSAVMLVGCLAAAACVLTGCGDLPTSPVSSNEETASAGMTSAAGLVAGAPAGELPQDAGVPALRDQGLSGEQIDPEHKGGVSSRYALAKASM